MTILDDMIALYRRLGIRRVKELHIIAAYRRLTSDRPQCLFQWAGTGSRQCILCGWTSGKYPTRWPLGPDLTDLEHAHIRTHIEEINRSLAQSSVESTE